ncbi:MAG TPA: DUF4442 domain-containing protein [Flavobacteriaceae bacterium]|nr:DUF4442 domain-containing protein [Flavobacteriaceae bacterium]
MKMNLNKNNINRFLLLKLPSAYLCGVRLKDMDNTMVKVTVKHRWINQNPFNSMYFAVQSMAAELSTGALVLKKISDSKQKVSMLVTNHSGSFTKKAKGKITFTCNDGNKIDKALKNTLITGEGETFTLNAIGIDESGDQVSNYQFEWSIKLKK